MGGKFGSQLRSGGKKAGSSNKGSLENCLKELKQIKRTIKDLKETCQNGWGIERKLQVLNSNSTPYRKEKSKERVRGGGKGSANSLSKYSYSNYKYFSSDRPNRSQDRLHESERKFNWMKNEKIQEFSIDASGEEL